MPLWRTGGVPGGTGVMSTPYACVRSSSTSCERPSQWSPSRHCHSVPRAGVVNARRPGHRPGRSEAESIDDAEHGTSIIRAMVARLDLSARPARVLLKNQVGPRTDRSARRRLTCALGSGQERRHAGGAVLLHELDIRTATRDTTNDGVNDPVPAPWGHVQGTTPGSFTPSLVL